MEYVIFNIGATIAYSKLAGPILKADMLKVRPQWTAGVPRLWEALRAGIYRNIDEHGGIKKALFNFFVSVGLVYSLLRNMARGLLPQFRKRVRTLDFLLAIIPLILMARQRRPTATKRHAFRACVAVVRQPGPPFEL